MSIGEVSPALADLRLRLLGIETRDEGDHDYESYHADRFAYVVAKCVAACPDRDAAVLDIGRSTLSLLLRTHYRSVTTLGFPLVDQAIPRDAADGAVSVADLAGHIVYDLNLAQDATAAHTSMLFDLIVFAEVVEHLYTAPELTVAALALLLKPGGQIVLQTPNASALHKRLMLLIGRNPYERIRINNKNPGHYREYTRAELFAIARATGLTVVWHEYEDYFGVNGSTLRRSVMRLYKLLARIRPALGRGQSISLRKPILA